MNVSDVMKGSEDITFSDKYANFIMPTTEQIAEEQRLSKLSPVEKQLELLRTDYLNGKIDKDMYDDLIGWELSDAVEVNKITLEKSNELYNKFKPV